MLPAHVFPCLRDDHGRVQRGSDDVRAHAARGRAGVRATRREHDDRWRLTIGDVPLTSARSSSSSRWPRPQLRRDGTGMSEIPTSAKAAERLGWTVTRFNRKLDNVCDKFDRIGVTGMRGGQRSFATNRRARLVEHVIASRLVGKSDLPLLDTAHRPSMRSRENRSDLGDRRPRTGGRRTRRARAPRSRVRGVAGLRAAGRGARVLAAVIEWTVPCSSRAPGPSSRSPRFSPRAVAGQFDPEKFFARGDLVVAHRRGGRLARPDDRLRRGPARAARPQRCDARQGDLRDPLRELRTLERPGFWRGAVVRYLVAYASFIVRSSARCW